MDLIISYKFNDIFYSLNYISKNYRILYFSKKEEKLKFIDNIKIDYFQLNNRYRLLKLRRFLKEKNYKVERVFLSNLELVTSQYIISFLNPKKIIIVEDGYYNYNSVFIKDGIKQRLKNLITRRNREWFLSKVTNIYTFMPNKVQKSFQAYSNRILKLNKIEGVPNRLLEEVNNKKIFIGQPLYSNNKDKYTYEKVVNEIIEEFDIDSYMEHRYSKNEKIKNKYDFYKYGYTLEMIAPLLNNLVIYTFSSSVLISLREFENIEINKVVHNQINTGSKLLTKICDNEIFLDFKV